MHARHKVSTKIAIYNHDGQSVLVMHYPRRGVNGLPGGHVERGEQPDFALRRELKEELNMEIGDIRRADFFLREGATGSVILAYTATAPEGLVIQPSKPRDETAEWMHRDQIAGIPRISSEYKRFVLENWPTK